mgnify:FL=1
MSAVLDFLAVFVHSDVAGPSPAWWHWINAQSSHFLFGVFFAVISPSYGHIGLYLWIAKEGFGDIPNDGNSLKVIADSVADLAFGYFGFFSRHRCTRHYSKQ